MSANKHTDEIDWDGVAKRLCHPDPGVRMAATVEAMSNQPPRAIQLALRGLLRDPDGAIREAAAQALGMQQDTDSTAELASLLTRTKPAEGYGIAWGLAELAIASGRADLVRLAASSLLDYRRRARGRSRLHADLLLQRLPQVGGEP